MNKYTAQGASAINADRRERMKAGRERKITERRAWRKAPLLSVGNWRIFRLDAMNFVLTDREENEDTYRYYPTLLDAAKALLHQHIHNTALPGLQALMNAVRKAETTVVSALLEGRLFTESLAENAPTAGGQE